MARTLNTLVTVAFLTAGALPMAVAQPSAAETPKLHNGYSHDPSRIVTYTRIDKWDLDVSTEDGARALLRRIELAADAVCGGADKALSAAAKRDYQDCRGDAISGAVSRMGGVKLQTLARGRQHERVAAR